MTTWRTYEVYQRMRVRETTALIKPRQLSSEAYLDDPYPLVAILREHYPCYRDWPQNAFWITRYDDVTSVFADEANYESRPRLWSYARVGWGYDLGADVGVAQSVADAADAGVGPTVSKIIDEFRSGQNTADLATGMCARLALELLVRALALPDALVESFVRHHLSAQRGVGSEPRARNAGLVSLDALAALFGPLLSQRAGGDGADLISVAARLGATAPDLVVTLVEADHQTLHGALANMWFLLLSHPKQLAVVRNDPRLMRFAYLEALRHSTPVVSADRFCRHEVERFGRLLPEGALLRCSAAAANRDPRVFDDPETFIVRRADICQREPRGTYRADGLASGISAGTGVPSKHPAVPEDRPRSRYALNRDIAVAASQTLLEAFPNISLVAGSQPRLRSLRLGEMHTCWHLPVEW